VIEHRTLDYPVLPVLRADNAEVLIHPDDRKYGALLIGSMGSGKTAALLRMVLNDVRDENAAPIIIDPKSELARLCLRLIPPECGKRVWFLDLGRPAFGVSPLRRAGERPLAIEAAAIAENVVAALSDISENQIFQSSRRYLYHAVIGALALAERESRRPKFEDVYSLLRPAKNEFRDKVAEACADQPDLDQTAEFFRSELPDDLKMASASVTQRLDAPRNKISGLTGVPPLRRFFNHPSDIPLREIIEARDVLLVDANMAAIGTENSRACMHFLLRMLHAQLQRQVHLPETERPRVPLVVDEAHYVADGENVVDQIATHRAAGLEVAFGLQYFAQLGSGSTHEEKIRKGVVNLLQSRFLFRLGDARDAEEATRIAMAVYATMIRDDPDSRARLRVTPEQALNFPNYHCLASWIAGGTRIPSFIGQTYPWPRASEEWERWHLERMHEQVGPYPEDLESTLDAGETEPRPAPPKDDNGAERSDAKAQQSASKTARSSAPATTGAKREVRVDVEPPAPLPNLADSPVRRVVGKPVRGPTCLDDQPAPESVHELAFFDRINEVGEADQLTGVDRLPRLYEADYAILKLIDRAGLAPRVLIGRATMPDRTANAVNDRLVKLYRHGLIAQHTIGVRQRTRADGALPLLYSLTRRGLKVAQARKPAPAISPKREWRPIEQRQGALPPHDLHVLSWAIAFHRTVGKLATDNWRTPRYVTGRYPVPQVGSGHRRHPISVSEIPLPDGQALIDIQVTSFGEVKPDVSLEVRIDAIKLTFDLLVELDLTERPSYNREKLLAYDAFLCGWCLEHPRYKTLGTRPVVVFVCRDERSLLGCAKVADEALTGRVGPMGAPADQWYYAARQHLFFARETDVHASRLSALALPSLPPDVRERLGERGLALTSVTLLPETVVKAASDS
jgi:Replication-relaxation